MKLEPHGRVTVEISTGGVLLHDRYYIEGAIEAAVIDGDRERSIRPDTYVQPSNVHDAKIA